MSRTIRHESAAFRAMGTDVHLIAVGPDAELAVGLGEWRVHELEAMWSRFLPDSEISRLNAAGGAAFPVSPETGMLIAAAIEGWRLTDGAFDPCVLPYLEDAGYDRDFGDIEDHSEDCMEDGNKDGAASTRSPPAWSPSQCGMIDVDRNDGTVRLPQGAQIDAGGVAKGFAADLLVAELRDHDVVGLCMNLGGDVRVWGRSPDSPRWRVEVMHPVTDEQLAVLEVDDCGLVTSTPLKRQWTARSEPQHHLIDPGTGRPASSRWSQVTVIASNATRAEILSKAVFLRAEAGLALLEHDGASALLLAEDGTLQEVGLGDDDG